MADVTDLFLVRCCIAAPTTPPTYYIKCAPWHSLNGEAAEPPPPEFLFRAVAAGHSESPAILSGSQGLAPHRFLYHRQIRALGLDYFEQAGGELVRCPVSVVRAEVGLPHKAYGGHDDVAEHRLLICAVHCEYSVGEAFAVETEYVYRVLDSLCEHILAAVFICHCRECLRC